MKIEITTGVHSSKKTKKCKLPLVSNTKILIDGKPIQDSINYIYMYIEAGEPVIWKIGYKKEIGYIKESKPLRRLKWYLINIGKRINKSL